MKEVKGAIDEEIQRLRDSWTLYTSIFYRLEKPGEDAKERKRLGDGIYELMGRCAPIVFFHFRWALLRSVITDLCRLCDRDSVGDKENLTLSRAAKETPFPDHRWNSQLERIADFAKEVVVEAGLPDLRNKVMAHADLGASLGDWKGPPIDHEQIDLAVRVVMKFHHQLMNPCSRDSHPQPDHQYNKAVEEEVDFFLQTIRSGLHHTERT